MLKGENINGYRILEDFKVAGGMSKISFAERDGKIYFIKEFLAPKYPTSDSPGSERIKEQKRKACDAFEKHHRDLNNAIEKCCAGTGGNLIYALNFFRNGASYYKVTEKIDISSFPCDSIARLPLEKILLIARSAVHSIKILHGLKIVHGDLKPDNLLIKEVKRGYVAKLIDFDDSYFEGNPPSERENLVGTPEYYSPEQAAYIMDEDEEIEGSTLTCKSDIFTLGIIFSEYFSGEKPVLPSEYKTTWTCVNDGGKFSFKKKLHPRIEELIRKMLSLNPSDRPSIGEVLIILQDIKPGETATPPSGDPSEKPKKPRLRIGPGLKPSRTKGGSSSDVPLSVPPTTVETPITKIKDPLPPTSESELRSSGLRGSGLKIADKE